ncbi:MAG: DPP IV N-terminal domain-containing protein [Bacteroidales bacterium]|nr:DPP IV N-terminal domain-containing protein [Bacteroidales bacterium]
MKKTISLMTLAMLLLMTLSAAAQEKKFFTPADASYNNRSLYAQRPTQLKWVGDQDILMKVDGKQIVTMTPGGKKEATFLTLDEINTYANAAGIDSLKRIPNLTWINDQKAYFYALGKDGIALNRLDIKKKTIEPLTTVPQGAENQTICDKTMRIAYTVKNNLFVADGDRQIQITDNPEGVVAGQSVHRNEFAIKGGIFWSPDGSKLAYYSMDERMVTDYPLVDITQRIATEKPIKYPMAGMTSHQVTLHVYDMATGKDLTIKTGEPVEQYLTAITWNPDNKRVYIGVLNRGQNDLKFNEYSAITGDFIQTIFEDTDEQYVEPQGPAYFVPNNTDQFIWMAQRDGYYHLYLYTISKKQVKQLTKGDFVITDFIGYSKDGQNIYYRSTEVSPLERHCYMMNIKNGKVTKLTKEHGTHDITPSKSGKYFIDAYNSTDVPYNVDLQDARGKFVSRLHEAENPIKDYNIGETTIGTLKAEDGQTLYTRLIKPYNFDSSKKYPVIVYVYGGPHAQLITDEWLAGAGIYLNYLAQEGFLVFTLDNRGSADRGEAFEQCIHRQCGQLEMRDQLVGIEWLKTLPYVDPERIGSDGWSYGGFMSTSLKVNHPEVFKVSVAGGPVLDWKYYEIMYGERYMDTPQENPEGYELTSLENKTDKLEGKLLMIHCTTDPVVVWQHSLVFVENCIHNGKQLDYFVYPGHDHNVYGMDRAHLITKITQYFKDNL